MYFEGFNFMKAVYELFNNPSYCGTYFQNDLVDDHNTTGSSLSYMLSRSTRLFKYGTAFELGALSDLQSI